MNTTRPQERGEVQRHGKVEVSGENLKTPTLKDIGLTKGAVHEARLVCDAEKNDPGVVRRTLDRSVVFVVEPPLPSSTDSDYA